MNFDALDIIGKLLPVLAILSCFGIWKLIELIICLCSHLSIVFI